MGKQRREHIKNQAEKIASLINVAPQAIKRDTNGVVPTPEQLDELLVLAEKRKAPTPASIRKRANV